MDAPPSDAADKQCQGTLADLDDPATGCATPSCDACPVPPGATGATCSASGACDYACLPTLEQTATGCGPAALQIVAAKSPSANDITCALTAHRNVKCWGQLGVSAPFLWDTDTAQLVPGLSNVRSIASGGGHFCAVTMTGGVACWGTNSDGQLGDGTQIDSPTPVAVVGLPSPAKVVAASLSHSCAVLETGAVWCWGSNRNLVLGRTTSAESPNPPGPITFTDPAVIQLASSRWHNCALRQGGRVLCWGANLSGELGNQQPATTSLPVEVTGIADATFVDVGGSASSVSGGVSGGYSFAVRADGTVSSWGYQSKLLGLGTRSSAVTTPTTIPSVTSIVALDNGPSHVCARASTGGVTCWGEASYGMLGEVGLATSSNYLNTPTSITEFGSTIRAVAAGRRHTCLVLDDQVRCAGANGAGQLGNTTVTDYSSTPLVVENWSFAD